MDLCRTSQTYVNRANAIKALEKACTKMGTTIDKVRYVIATNEEGRFAPCVVGQAHFDFIHAGVTVIG